MADAKKRVLNIITISSPTLVLVAPSILIQAESVSEGVKHLISLCEKIHFAPVQNHLLLLQTVQLHHNNLYSDCCIDDYYPDNFGSLVLLFNHITSRVM
jgi:hypothetical protein